MSATKRVEDARSRLMFKAPFYSVLARKLPIVETTNVRDQPVDTYATDGTALYVNPAFDATLTPRQREGVIVHEVEHCARGDHLRRGARSRHEWNVATDIRINGAVTLAGFDLPKDVILRPDLAHESAERIYAILGKEAQAKRDAEEKAQEEARKQAEESDDSDAGAADESESDDKPNDDGAEQGESDAGDESSDTPESDTGDTGDAASDKSDAGETGDDGAESDAGDDSDESGDGGAERYSKPGNAKRRPRRWNRRRDRLACYGAP